MDRMGTKENVGLGIVISVNGLFSFLVTFFPPSENGSRTVLVTSALTTIHGL